MKLRLSSLVLILMCLAAQSALADAQTIDPRDRLERALQRYAEALEQPDRDERIAKFAQAEAGFAAALESGAENAALHTNRGNAALQSEEIGRAVLAYRRALRLDPDAQSARQNLAHVRALFPTWVPRPVSDEDAGSFLFLERISQANRSTAAAICFVLAAASLAISVRRREGAWRGLALVVAALWAILLASIVFDATAAGTNDAVVTADEALARSADSRLAALAYPDPLPAGVEVEVLEERAEWVRVRLHNGRDVWLRASSVTRVAE